MKKTAIILALLILLTACSANVSESTINTITSNRSTEKTSEISEANTSITDATSESNIAEDWEFNKDKLPDRLTGLAIKDRSWEFFPLVKYSLCDLDFDGFPELVVSHTDMGMYTNHELYNLILGQNVGLTASICHNEGGYYSTELTDIFSGIYYIDSKTNQRYFIQSGLAKWGPDGYTNVYIKGVVENGILIDVETINFPLSDDGSPQYNPEERINLFAPDDKFENLYIKSVTLEELWRNDEKDIEKTIKSAMEKLVNDYYSGIENNSGE